MSHTIYSEPDPETGEYWILGEYIPIEQSKEWKMAKKMAESYSKAAEETTNKIIKETMHSTT